MRCTRNRAHQYHGTDHAGSAAIKQRVLADPDNGMEAGDREDDLISLRQIRDFIDREARQ